MCLMRSSTPTTSRPGGTPAVPLSSARPFGNYAVEWPTGAAKDEVLGRMGGVFRGTVIEFKPGREFFVADAYWLPPDGDPIGPMAFEASCTTLGERVVLRVRQSAVRTPADGHVITKC